MSTACLYKRKQIVVEVEQKDQKQYLLSLKNKMIASEDKGAKNMNAPIRDKQTVTPKGERITQPLDGVKLRWSNTIPDERGELCEILDMRWGFSNHDIPYVYMAMSRPNVIKGWVVHYHQYDRLFVVSGSAKIVLYDAREQSPTYGQINEHYITERNRGLLSIPEGVFHAVQNIGNQDLYFINMPSQPYNHENPDKYRLPINDPSIPYVFKI